MDALDLMGRAAVIVLGLGAALHYHTMASKAERGPVYIKYILLPATTGVGAMLIGAGLWQHPQALMVAPWIGTALALLMLAVHLGLWANGAYACRAMDHAAAIKAARSMVRAVDDIKARSAVDAEWLTLASREYLWEQEERERAAQAPADQPQHRSPRP